MFYMSQMNPKKLTTILNTQFNHHTLAIPPFKMNQKFNMFEIYIPSHNRVTGLHNA